MMMVRSREAISRGTQETRGKVNVHECAPGPVEENDGADITSTDEDLEVVDMDLDSSDSDDDPFKYDNDYVVVDSSVFSLAAAKARIALLARSLVPTFQEAWREGNALFNKTWTPARFGVQLRSMEKYNIFWDVQTR